MMRILSSLLLALVLALTSQSMAVARGASAATGQMVLCTGAGTMVVNVDAQGQPTSAPHICPDAALVALLETQAPDLTAPQTVTRFAVGASISAMPALPLLQVAPPSRGPPLTL